MARALSFQPQNLLLNKERKSYTIRAIYHHFRMKKSSSNKYHKRPQEDLPDFIKKLELQAVETAEERYPLYLDVGLKDAHHILDVGCGAGFVTRDIARLTKGAVIGIDGALNLLSVASQILHDYPNTRLMSGDAQHLPFKDNSFDIVCSFDVLEHIDNDQQAMREMYRVASKEGLAVILVPAYNFL